MPESVNLLPRSAAQLGMIIFDVLALIAVILVVDYHLEVYEGLESKSEELTYDSGSAYYLLALIMPCIHTLILLAESKPKRALNQFQGKIAIGVLLTLLVLIYATSFTTQYSIEQAGYVACKKTRATSVEARGEAWLYKLGNCHAENSP